jgi:chromosome partitioning protein
MARRRGSAPLVTAVLLVGAAFAAPQPPASAQGGKRLGDRAQPPTELLEEYPFQQGRLRSRGRSEGNGVGSAESAAGRTPDENGGWPVIWLMLAATALVLLGVLGGRRVRRAGAAGLDAVPEPERGRDPHSPPARSTPPIGPRPARFRRERRRRHTNSYAVVNQKGGVGKTTVSLTLGAAAVRRGSRALLLDLDPQASATSVLGPDAEFRPTMTDVMLPHVECTLADAVRPTEWGLDLAPADRLLRSLDSGTPMRDPGVLARQLERVTDYDLMLIDCPPNLGTLTIDALAAASRALVVTEPTFLAMHALEELLATLRVVAIEENPSLELAGVVVNRVETTAEHKRSRAELEDAFGSQIWEPYVPKRAILQDAMRCGMPPQELQTHSHYAIEITEIFDALAARLERIPAKS